MFSLGVSYRTQYNHSISFLHKAIQTQTTDSSFLGLQRSDDRCKEHQRFYSFSFPPLHEARDTIKPHASVLCPDASRIDPARVRPLARDSVRRRKHAQKVATRPVPQRFTTRVQLCNL